MDIGWGELWKAISKTFEVGGQVHRALIGEREQKRAISFGREQLNAQSEQDKIALLLSGNNSQTRIITIAIIGMILFILFVLWLKK